mmetsp:Transcript_63551/g.113435  ORF Transcript_63551/g.113435 Transcript_63551/m.113435 type:complete len:211 (-) Transcript_63551:134-766(-)
MLNKLKRQLPLSQQHKQHTSLNTKQPNPRPKRNTNNKRNTSNKRNLRAMQVQPPLPPPLVPMVLISNLKANNKPMLRRRMAEHNKRSKRLNRQLQRHNLPTPPMPHLHTTKVHMGSSNRRLPNLRLHLPPRRPLTTRNSSSSSSSRSSRQHKLPLLNLRHKRGSSRTINNQQHSKPPPLLPPLPLPLPHLPPSGPPPPSLQPPSRPGHLP